MMVEVRNHVLLMTNGSNATLQLHHLHGSDGTDHPRRRHLAHCGVRWRIIRLMIWRLVRTVPKLLVYCSIPRCKL
jgi:hypothetical protein